MNRLPGRRNPWKWIEMQLKFVGQLGSSSAGPRIPSSLPSLAKLKELQQANDRDSSISPLGSSKETLSIKEAFPI